MIKFIYIYYFFLTVLTYRYLQAATIPQRALYQNTKLNKTITLINNDYIFTYPFHFGSERQKIDIVFDTGSLILWVNSINCTQCNGSLLYDYEKSVNFVKKEKQVKKLEYVSGECNGYQSLDSILFEQIRIKQIDITMVFEKKNLNINGILGLGFYGKNILDQAYKIGLISSNVFAFQLRSLSQKYKSIFYYDVSKVDFPSANYININNNAYQWKLHGTLLIQNQKIIQYDFIIDSGTQKNIVVPFGLLDGIFYKYFADKKCSLTTDGQKHIACRCDQSYPQISFKFGNKILTIDKRRSFYRVDDYWCAFIVTQLSNFLLQKQKIILIGEVLFRDYIIIFDKKERRIGFQKNKFGYEIIPENSLSYVQFLYSFIALVFIFIGITILLIHKLYNLIKVIKYKKFLEEKENQGTQQHSIMN